MLVVITTGHIKLYTMYFSKQDIDNRRARLAPKWNDVLAKGEAVLVYAGAPIQKPGGLDNTYTYLPHPSYYWLTGRRREEEVILYSVDTGWVEFQKVLGKETAFWEGEKHDVLVDTPGKSLQDLDAFLKQFTAVYKLGQTPEYKKEGKAFTLNTLLDQTRRVKDEAEIKLIRHIADIAVHGYKKISEVLRPGITEREIQIAYEAEIFRNGAQTTPYDSIVGSGPNAAILHFAPSQRVVGEQELVLVDAGADIYDYCVDITRTFISSGEMESRQKALYQLVKLVQDSCTKMTKPGVYWRDVHNKAAALFTEGLLHLGILKGNLSDLLAQEVVYMFFPHGLGHLVGLRVRDTGQEENLHPKTYFGARLRVDIQLEPGHLITMEPGMYFIKPLLEDADNKKKFKECINWEELSHWMNIGGVRIEDNLLITDTGNDNLTAAIPKISI